MEINYLKGRGVALLIVIWIAILSGIAYLRQSHLAWSRIVTETETSPTAEAGLLFVLGFIGVIIFFCLYDWD